MTEAQPTLAGFLTFVRNFMGIPSNYLPDDSPQIGYAYNWALDIVSLSLLSACQQMGAWGPYARAVYNLAGHTLVEWAVDQSYPLASLAWSGGSVSGATAVANAILPGDRVQIVNVSPLAYAGPQNLRYVVVLATPTDTEFQYAVASNPGTATLLTGAAVLETYFAQLRTKFNLGIFAPGVVASASDVSTSTGLLNQDFMKGLTLEDLQLLKTPWGRAYMAIAQKIGPTIWGVA